MKTQKYADDGTGNAPRPVVSRPSLARGLVTPILVRGAATHDPRANAVTCQQEDEPKRRKMSRVEKELASLAPWAWDPLVVRHAPGSAMMRDFTEVVADKTVTGGNAQAYRFKSPDLAGTPGVKPPSSVAATPAPSALNGVAPASSTQIQTATQIRVGKRTRSPPSSRREDATPAPATAARGTPVAPNAKASMSARATPTTGQGRTHPRLASASSNGQEKPGGRSKDARRAQLAPVANLVKALDEAVDADVPKPKAARRASAGTPAQSKAAAKRREQEERELQEKEEKAAADEKEAKEKEAARKKAAREAKEAAAEVKRAAAAAKRKAQREDRERAQLAASDAKAAAADAKENRDPIATQDAVKEPTRARAVPRELAGLDPISGPDARRQREAALLAVAAVEAAAEAEAAKPSMTKAQSLLAAYYGLTGRTPPAGVSLPDMSIAAPAMERAKKAKDAHNTAVFGASYKPSFNAGGVENFSGEFRPVCLGPFGGVDRTGDFARYHGQPRRVVSAGAQFAAACDYLGRRDVVEATKAE
jgi:hypothetical protein